MKRARYILALAVLTAGGCGGAQKAQSSPSPRAVATLLIEAKGVTMPLNLAVRSLAFKPFLPPGEIVQTAVIPPLNVDQQRNHGIAFEYVSGGAAFLLSQWPRAGFQVPPSALSRGTCVPVSYKTDAYLWNTESDLVMTLQPDGQTEPSRVASEARRLIQHGACREAATTPRRSPRSRAVSSPRQSAS